MFSALLSGTHQIGELDGLTVKLPGLIHYVGTIHTPPPEDDGGGLPHIQLRLIDTRGVEYCVTFAQETPARVRFTVKRAK